MVCEDSCIKPLSHAVYKPGRRSAYANVINRRSNVAIVVPSPRNTTRAYGTCKAIRCRL
nr:MAG TPA: hypothetical protein [Bacteriophage sp.]